jgi:CBS domain-containing protein
MPVSARSATFRRLLEIHTVEVASGRGVPLKVSSVHCPPRHESVWVGACAVCGSGGDTPHDPLARGEYLACRCESGAVEIHLEGDTIADRTPVARVMQAEAVALRPDVTREAAATVLRARALLAAPVVDGEGRPIGAVREVDLLRSAPGSTVADAMSRVAMAVGEGASVGRAARVLSAERAEVLPVVGAGGTLVGVLTAHDVLAWMAAQDGLLAPAESPAMPPE